MERGKGEGGRKSDEMKREGEYGKRKGKEEWNRRKSEVIDIIRDQMYGTSKER